MIVESSRLVVECPCSHEAVAPEHTRPQGHTLVSRHLKGGREVTLSLTFKPSGPPATLQGSAPLLRVHLLWPLLREALLAGSLWRLWSHCTEGHADEPVLLGAPPQSSVFTSEERWREKTLATRCPRAPSPLQSGPLLFPCPPLEPGTSGEPRPKQSYL